MKATFTYFLGLFLVALSTVMYEVLLTRIFSVTTWYHFAFLAITLAMLGMTVGAIIVYLKPNLFTEEKTHHFSAVSAVCFALTSIAAVLVHIYSPALIPSNDISSIIFGSLFASLPILLIAFAFSGICISLALTRFPSQVNALYAADLIGAAIGSSGIVFMLQIVDGISLALLVGALNCIAAVFFVWGRKDTRTMAVSLALGIGLIVLTVINSGSNPLLAITWTKGIREGTVLYQKWNSFSRVRVIGDADRPYRPLGSFSSTIPDTRVQQLSLDIDGCAQTVLTRYTGDKKDASHLPYDVVNMVHYLRPQSKVLVIGMGGGRDMLSALVMDQPSVTGVEINPNIIKAVNETFGDFTGHLDRNPRVRIVNEEARSFISHSKEKFDIIVASLVDTWAASASGAYSMSETSLYTIECWKSMISHLTDTGVLSMSRFYDKEGPAEFYRLTSLAAEALKQSGISDPRKHICAVILHNPKQVEGKGQAIATILVKKSPFTEDDVARLKEVCQKLDFDLALTPTEATDPLLAKIADRQLEAVSQQVPWNLTPPTDDNPFFFQMFSLSHAFDPRCYVGRNAANAIAGPLLLLTAVSVGFFTFYCFRIPFLRTKDKSTLRGTKQIFTYFFCIGLGFMFVEISQIQRFTIFLGHPTYGATVVLTVLLFATGLGSLFLKKAIETYGNYKVTSAAIMAVLFVFSIVSPLLIQQLSDAGTPVRIAATALILVPVGLVLGTFFPLGMTIASNRYQTLTPWLWGINGAASVLGSVLSIVASMIFSISFSFLLGLICYVVAVWMLVKMMEKEKPTAAE